MKSKQNLGSFIFRISNRFERHKIRRLPGTKKAEARPVMFPAGNKTQHQKRANQDRSFLDFFL